MRALVGDGKGSVVPAGVDEPLPKPHEAVVAVEAVSINRGEIFRLELAAAGWRPGKDFAGVFVRAAGDGSGPVAGTRVVGHGPHHSRWAEHVAISIDRIVDVPPDLSSEIAAALPLSGLTALRLARSARLSPGTSVLMTGVSGGGATPSASSVVGAGAYLIAIVRMQLRDEVWRRFGATTLTDVTDAPTEFDVGMESIDGTSLAEVRKGVSPDGNLIWFGQAGRTPATLAFVDEVNGTAGAPFTQFEDVESDRPLQRDLATFVDLAACGHMHPVFDRIRTASDAAVIGTRAADASSATSS